MLGIKCIGIAKMNWSVCAMEKQGPPFVFAIFLVDFDFILTNLSKKRFWTTPPVIFFYPHFF